MRNKGFVFTDDKKKTAIQVYEMTGLKASAAKAVGCCTKTIEREQKKDKDFDEAMKEAKELYADSLVNVARERAMKGGNKNADLLLMFLIKKERPEYRDRVDVSGKVDANIKIISAVPRPAKQKKEGQVSTATH